MKILASDFDETLYFKNEGIKEGDANAIESFQREGNLFGICSGRPFIGMKEYLGRVHPDFYIQCSGALILNRDGRVIFDRPVPKEIVQIVCYHKTSYSVVCFAKDAMYMNVDMRKEMPFIHTLDELIQDDVPVYGFSVNCKNEDEASRVKKEIECLPGINVFQNRNSLDVVSGGCSKKQGVAFIQMRNEGAEVASIGDSYNDIPMLEYAKNSYTFASSPDAVKKSAKYIVNSIQDAIEEYMKLS